MGAHSSAESLMAGVEADSIRVKAAALAVQMTGWLTEGRDITPLQIRCRAAQSFLIGNVPADYHEADPDLVEWCRSVRDVLEAVGRG